MRYQESTPDIDLPLYQEAGSIGFMLNFTVSLALLIGFALIWLGRRGRVLWLQVWSVGLVIASVLYLGAAAMGYS